MLLLRIFIGLTGTILAVFLTFYLKVRIYDFPAPQPFSGQHWYNPYARLGDTLLRANFHAHTYCWWGITNGEDTEAAMHQAYQEEGYAVVGISNYHAICTYHADDPAFVPVYEHGLNPDKIHTLAIGARKVAPTLFPWHFSIHQKQQEIEAVGQIATLVALAHPTTGRYHPREISLLSGFQLMEVGHSTGIEEAQWDVALSSGKPVWILCNDDTHSLTREPPFNRWSRIYCSEVSGESVVRSLTEGRHYGVWAYDEACEDNRITEFKITGDTLYFAVRDTANRIDLIGQDGQQRATVAGDRHIAYLLKPDDTYVRVEVHHDHGIMYLNPVVRYDGTLPYGMPPAVNQTMTWLVRIGVAGLILLVVVVTRRMLRQTRQPR